MLLKKVIVNTIKFTRISINEKLMLIEALFLFLKTIFFVKILPLKYYHNYIGNYMKEMSLDENSNYNYDDVISAIRRAKLIIPFRTKCLVNSIVLKKMLDKRSIKNMLYLGVYKNNYSSLNAHAWVNINNKSNSDKYKIIAYFS
ncbi:MAG: hypothetical protein A2033_08190 [Bacteroidetes bacterium GWA2_31_9]|nr:MAG: hypothetical protein A2033_08190 [Bacteroidetes bacterium GWA2_31_9]